MENLIRDGEILIGSGVIEAKSIEEMIELAKSLDSLIENRPNLDGFSVDIKGNDYRAIFNGVLSESK